MKDLTEFGNLPGELMRASALRPQQRADIAGMTRHRKKRSDQRDCNAIRRR